MNCTENTWSQERSRGAIHVSLEDSSKKNSKNSVIENGKEQSKNLDYTHQKKKKKEFRL